MPPPTPAAVVRLGYGSGSVATGAFGTVPGLMLLPYLTDSLGIAAVAAGFIVFAPKAWDVVLNPIAGRISDRTVDPRGPRRPWLLRAGLGLAVAFALLFAAPAMGSKGAEARWVLVCFVACATAYAFFQVPYVSMPAEMTVVLRRAHPADDLAGGDPRLHDHARRRDRSGDPRRGRRPGRLPGDGRRDGAGHRWSAWSAPTAAPGTPRSARSRPGRARCATSCGSSPARATSGCCWSPSSCRRSPPAACSPASTTWPPTCSTARARRTILFVCFVGPALLLTPAWSAIGARIGKKQGYLASSVILAAGALLAVLARSAPFGLVVAAVVLVGVGYAGCQVFPLAMLPDAAAVDARRTGSSTGSASTPASGPPARRSASRSGPGCSRWCWPSAATGRAPTATSPSRTRR